MSSAILTAPFTLSWPAPCSKLLAPFIGWAVYMRTALSRFGVSEGLASSKRAAAPDTTAVDIEVPLRYIICFVGSEAVPGLRLGYLLIRLAEFESEAVEQAPSNLFPGAQRSGLMRSL